MEEHEIKFSFTINEKINFILCMEKMCTKHDE